MVKNIPDELYSLTLTLTSRCNLGCSYCYVPKDGKKDMDASVARAAVDLLGESPRSGLTLSFFGGEPFLALDAMQAALARASEVLDGRHHVTCTTNGMAMGARACGLVREHAVELAMSLDGMEGPDERAGSRQQAARNAAQVQALCPDDVMARMTVTPTNVGHLVANIRSLARLGFKRIVYQPAVELGWDARAVETWAEEHRRLGTWMLGLRSAGRRGPELPPWNQVMKGLKGGRLGACGAGTRLATVRTDGSLVPCYRLAFGSEPVRIGDVESGFERNDVFETFASLTPEGRRPEHGDCASCEARAGCTYYCPAMGQIMLGDPRAVPVSACNLMRAQVREVARYAETLRRARSAPGRRVMRWAAAAVAAAASTCITTGCGESKSRDAHDEADVADTAGDGSGDVGGDVPDFYPGLCPVEPPPDAVTDGESDPSSDTTTDTATDPAVDPDPEPSHDYYPGTCPVEAPYDAPSDTERDPARDREEIGPGVCPWPGIC